MELLISTVFTCIIYLLWHTFIFTNINDCNFGILLVQEWLYDTETKLCISIVALLNHSAATLCKPKWTAMIKMLK